MRLLTKNARQLKYGQAELLEISFEADYHSDVPLDLTHPPHNFLIPVRGAVIFWDCRPDVVEDYGTVEKRTCGGPSPPSARKSSVPQSPPRSGIRSCTGSGPRG